MSETIRCELARDGVLTAVIDMPGRTMNVFSAGLMDALEALLDRVERSADVHSVVLTSGKPAFLAGADLVMIREFTERARTATPDEMFLLCGRLGRLFVRLEASAKPWIAAVNGTALGGGLELAMACRARIVSDQPRILLGLPEVRLGLLPGAGGTQRLPRLIGFEPAVSLLLSGRSLPPADAVALGVFSEVAPATGLLERARAIARAAHGRPYDAPGKYPHLAGADVPSHSASVAQEIARRHGIGGDDFQRYPAYGAIIDSVLLGARLPLAAATDVEMRQFLRLMFDPVAGNMVRTLFLNRQRADRELAPPPEMRVDRIGCGELSAAAHGWAEALAKSKIPCAPDPALPRDTIELEANDGQTHRVAVGGLADGDAERRLATPTAVLSPAGPHGRVLEIVAAADAAAAALAFVATRLGAVPYRTRGETSALRRLAAAAQGAPDATLDAQAMEALRLAEGGLAPDVELLDVAACVAGVTPAYAGGPFAHLWQHREALGVALTAEARRAWTTIESRLRKAYA